MIIKKSPTPNTKLSILLDKKSGGGIIRYL